MKGRGQRGGRRSRNNLCRCDVFSPLHLHHPMWTLLLNAMDRQRAAAERGAGRAGTPAHAAAAARGALRGGRIEHARRRRSVSVQRGLDFERSVGAFTGGRRGRGAAFRRAQDLRQHSRALARRCARRARHAPAAPRRDWRVGRARARHWRICQARLIVVRASRARTASKAASLCLHSDKQRAPGAGSTRQMRAPVRLRAEPPRQHGHRKGWRARSAGQARAMA
jgi:hypothetical protein